MIYGGVLKWRYPNSLTRWMVHFMENPLWKMDDSGAHLSQESSIWLQVLGPWFIAMKCVDVHTQMRTMVLEYLPTFTPKMAQFRR